MVAPQNTKSALDDSLMQLQILQLDGGLNTQTGAFSIGPNQTPDALNVFSYGGNLQGRGGYNLFSSLTSQADAMFTFFDASNNRHVMLWMAGSLYDCTNGIQTLVASTVYTTGQQIAFCELNNVMYWATATVPLRQYDGSVEKAVPNSGGVGTVAPPAGFYMMVYAGSIVMFRPVVAGTTFLSSFMWSNVNDPTTWIGANIQGVGNNDGGAIMWGISLGVPSFIVGKSVGAQSEDTVSTSLWVYSGALAPGSLIQTGVSCDIGAFDPNSAVLVPDKEGVSNVLFIASDGHWWKCNGVQAWLACPNILGLAESYIRNAFALNSNTKYFATYYNRWQYYICNVGQNTQLVYVPSKDAWWLFSGWPNGPFTTFISSTTGLPGLFTAANNSGQTGMFQVALDQTNDNGSNPVMYYRSPNLHGGKPQREKEYQWYSLYTYNVGAQYAITGQGLPWNDNTVDSIDSITFQDAAATGPNPTAGGIWDVSLWDEALWGGGYSQIAQPFQPMVNHAPIRITAPVSEWIPPGEKEPLKSGAAQFTITWVGGVPDFQVIGYALHYEERGLGFVGMGTFEDPGDIDTTPNIYTTFD